MISEKTFSIIIAGGFHAPYRAEYHTFIEVKSGNSRTRNLGYVQREDPLMGASWELVLHNGGLYLFDGRICWLFDKGTWKQHSAFNRRDIKVDAAISTEIGIFIFGYGFGNCKYEYLLNDQNTWNISNKEVPGGFKGGSAILIESKQEIWLIGGQGTEHRILTFNIRDFTFKKLPLKLKIGRFGHRCAMIPGINKIMISGGHTYDGISRTSTEILDPETMSITVSSPMNISRAEHGMVWHGNRLAVFGGYDGSTELGSFELYNTQTKKWELTQELSLQQEKRAFGYLSVKSDLIYKYLK